MSELIPDLLAGPILRRVTPKKICFWISMSQPAEFRLKLSAMDEAVNPVQDRRLAIGKRLHIHLLDFRYETGVDFDQWVDYTLEYRFEGASDWKDVTQTVPGLLYDGRDKMGFTLTKKVESILHGSCRKPHHDSEDGLVEADNLVYRCLSEDGADLPSWPSMMVLSGDQIYGDDVAGPMLRAIHRVMEKLEVYPENLEKLGITGVSKSDDLLSHARCYYGRDEILPQTEANRDLMETLVKGVRKPIFTTDTAHNHLITLGEYTVMYLMVWSPIVWKELDLDLSPPEGMKEAEHALYSEEKEILNRFVEGLPKVQRVMAHMPIAMIFDDHDVTDDWNLNREWEETVYGHPFSQRIIGNGLISFMMAQGWGNRPEVFNDEFFDRLQETLKAPGSEKHNEMTDWILKFDEWDFVWESSPPLIVLDTRTRRWRSESSPVKPSGLLDWEAIIELQQKLQGRDKVLLVSAAPIFGVKLIETIQKIFTFFGKPLMVDAENWMAHPGTAASILNVFRHSKTPQTFVVLSGDVHYSFVFDVELRGYTGGPDIWQICSSGLRNEFPKKLLANLDWINRWLFAPKSPLNWLTKRRHMRVIPRKPEGNKDGHRLLNGSGIGLVELDEMGRPWRIRQCVAGGDAIGFDRMEHHSRNE